MQTASSSKSLSPIRLHAGKEAGGWPLAIPHASAGSYIATMQSPDLFAGIHPPPERFVPEKIVSGGQTGVDRGALDAAIMLGIAHGGWCPAGRLAEDGRVPSKYQLDELESRYYPDRTEQNVIDSDATLLLYRGKITGGTKLTLRICRKANKPSLSVSVVDGDECAEEIAAWLAEIRPTVLNVAGPRESNAKGIQVETRELLLHLLG
ncbi:putative molybdenum carrier protein [Aporhodopirellula aestuarii]|uniref:Molybdenum carrier protein n=1 Tax=Aporhodopirellula aestuarii TaxID=2950107 RepID=A0ABT0U022_9BACT|nr:putative molybdenum carrier protein [Aporhodopirellula aestuarii]MCM2370182.1 putative molybdenum carrier protein [Aporhodopirellula aestuarii]